MSDYKIGIERASKQLKEKLREKKKLTLKDYRMSNQQETQEEKPLAANQTKEEKHKNKPNKFSFYLSNEAKSALEQLYIDRLTKSKKTTRSDLVCEALEFFFHKTMKRSS